jgi:hypothetical protein
MKNKIFYSITLFAIPLLGWTQVSSVPAEDIDPEDSVQILVDLSALDVGKDYNQNLLDAHDNGEDMYMWTWKPYEFPDGHPKANGTGGAPWKSSNEILKMTHEGGTVYSIKLVPTDFYEVDAATVYKEDIHFLVKPKDGGGYGDPDIKSDDLKLVIDPPVTEKKPQYGFPTTLKQDDIFTVYYDNDREEKESMQNMHPDSCYAYSECTLASGTVVKVANFFQVGNTPELQMEYYDDQRFRLTMIPFDFFGLVEGDKIVSMKFVIMKKVYLTSKDRVDEDLIIDVCSD